MIALGWLAAALAGAPGDEAVAPEDVVVAPDDEAVAPEPAMTRARWGGIAIPLVGANSTDGLGFGLGGELFRRPRDPASAEAYDLKLTLSTYITVSGRFQSHFAQLEARGERSLLVQLGLSRWTNLLYAGQGGADVLRVRPEDEGGNEMLAPFGMVALTVPVGQWSIYGQGFARAARIAPRPGGLLDAERPFGAEGGAFGDVALGLYREEVDRWPLPERGWLLDASARVGVGSAAGQLEPVGGAHVEAAGWLSPVDGLALGARGIASHTAGTQPVFVQELLPGRWRDEAGYEQPLTGYGRTRPRGDGLLAALFEVRPRVGRVHRGFFDIALHGSLFAEAAWLLDRSDPGPPLPTLGLGPVLVWQEATVLRPFFAWGWRGEPGEARRPVMQFGLALKDPL